MNGSHFFKCTTLFIKDTKKNFIFKELLQQCNASVPNLLISVIYFKLNYGFFFWLGSPNSKFIIQMSQIVNTTIHHNCKGKPNSVKWQKSPTIYILIGTYIKKHSCIMIFVSDKRECASFLFNKCFKDRNLHLRHADSLQLLCKAFAFVWKSKKMDPNFL